MSARIRTVKPELFRHLKLFESEKKYQLPLRIAFVGLFTCCDREGRFRWQAHCLKFDVLPYDDLDFGHILDVFHALGFIKKYEVDGEFYGCIPSWNRHQAINCRESASIIPEPVNFIAPADDFCFKQGNKNPKMAENNVVTPTENDPETMDFDDLSSRVSDGPVGNGRELKGREKEWKGREEEKKINQKKPEQENNDSLNSGFDPAPPDGGGLCVQENFNFADTTKISSEKISSGKKKSFTAQDVSEIFKCWQNVLNHHKAKFDAKRKRCIESALQCGYTVEELCMAIRGCSCSAYHMGDNKQGEIYDELTLILRNASKIEYFMRKADPTQQPSSRINADDDSIESQLSRYYTDPFVGVH